MSNRAQEVEAARKADDLVWSRLARNSYLVVPKLAICAMPVGWQARLEDLLSEADAAGLETPDYFVFRGGDDEYTRARMVNWSTGFVKIAHGREDPWANYKYGDVKELCPAFKEPAQ